MMPSRRGGDERDNDRKKARGSRESHARAHSPLDLTNDSLKTSAVAPWIPSGERSGIGGRHTATYERRSTGVKEVCEIHLDINKFKKEAGAETELRFYQSSAVYSVGNEAVVDNLCETERATHDTAERAFRLLQRRRRSSSYGPSFAKNAKPGYVKHMNWRRCRDKWNDFPLLSSIAWVLGGVEDGPVG
ncbi:hypothetical protein EJ02DRAFT_511973 [Clathrospora elynae]|uniref:Uncharacterized protein n=1 Tax=Clathrospora elynae TaxID=706981 RepID=A0A6A5SQN4_9PLEO|nr:hypothetical protein EJ02DRAFT_511973 [Clathrospora elynae]